MSVVTDRITAAADALVSRDGEYHASRTALRVTLSVRVGFYGRRPLYRGCNRKIAPFTVRAEREVIVCAGAYHSPHLLLLSGLGPADDLRAGHNRVSTCRSGTTSRTTSWSCWSG
jgi:hypothetical protein